MQYSLRKTIIRFGVGFAGLLILAPGANALELDISGHADRMVRAADNNASGDALAGSDIQHLDNGADQSRFRMQGSQETGNGIAGVDLEMRIGDTSECYNIKTKTAGGGFPASQNQTQCDSAVEWSRADAFYEGGWGRVSLGKGDSASRGSDRADLSGTDLIMNYDNRRNASLVFMSEGASPTEQATYWQVFGMYEGARSQNRARYDSPVWGGFRFAVSNANTDKYAVGATWANAEESDLQIRVAAGYTVLDSFSGGTLANSFDQMQSISASVLLAGGFNFTAGYGSTNNTVPGGAPGLEDPGNWQFKFGYTWNDIAVAMRYVDASDVLGRSGDDGSSVRIGAQWVANEWLDVYGGYEVAKFDSA